MAGRGPGSGRERAYAWLTAAERYEAALALLTKPGDDGLAASLCVQLSHMLRLPNKPLAIRYGEEACTAGGGRLRPGAGGRGALLPRQRPLV